MHHPLVQLSDGLAHSGCRTLLYTMIVFLVLLQSGDGQHQVVGPSQPIRATIGDDIILPCHLDPAKDASDMKLEWARPDLNPRFIHVRANRQEYIIHKQPSYKGRTSVSNDKLKHGDVSLTLSKVKVSDEGMYRCLIPSLNQAAFIQLIVGAVSSPVISLENRSSRRVVLQCESAGWYPEPEVLWLDGEGKLLSAGPTETVRGPDDLYTVSSRVTVEKRHSNSFTCRVQQRNINQTTETHISMSDDFFKVQSSSSSTITGLAVSLAAVCILLILLLVFFVCKLRNNRTKTKRSPSDERDTGRRDNPSGEEMKPLKRKEEKKSKHWLVSRQKYQEEQQRREEAENKVTVLEQKLEKQLQDEEDSRMNSAEEVKTLKQQLQTKDTELQEEKKSRKEFEEKFEGNQVETIKQVQVQTQLKDRAQSEVQTLKNQLETKRREEAETKRQLDTKTSEWKKLQTELLEEKKTNTNLEKEVTTLKEDIKMKDTQLQDEHTRREEAERQVQRKQQELQKKTQELQVQTQLKVTAQSEVQTLKNQLETKIREMEGKQPETIRQVPQGQEEAQSEVQTLKNQLETKIKEFEKQLQDEKKKKTELEKKLKTLEEELQKNNTQLQGEKKKNTELEKELETLKEELQNKDRQGVRRRGWSFWRKRRP